MNEAKKTTTKKKSKRNDLKFRFRTVMSINCQTTKRHCPQYSAIDVCLDVLFMPNAALVDRSEVWFCVCFVIYNGIHFSLLFSFSCFVPFLCYFSMYNKLQTNFWPIHETDCLYGQSHLKFKILSKRKNTKNKRWVPQHDWCRIEAQLINYWVVELWRWICWKKSDQWFTKFYLKNSMNIDCKVHFLPFLALFSLLTNC